MGATTYDEPSSWEDERPTGTGVMDEDDGYVQTTSNIADLSQFDRGRLCRAVVAAYRQEETEATLSSVTEYGPDYIMVGYRPFREGDIGIDILSEANAAIAGCRFVGNDVVVIGPQQQDQTRLPEVTSWQVHDGRIAVDMVVRYDASFDADSIMPLPVPLNRYFNGFVDEPNTGLPEVHPPDGS